MEDYLPDLPVDKLPEDVRALVFDSHFNVGEKGNAIPIRMTSTMQQAMSVMLQRLEQQGGVPWLQTYSDMVRMGTFFLLALLKGCLESPPDTLSVILATEKSYGMAQTRKVLTEKMFLTLELTGEQVQDLLKDPLAEGEIEKILLELLETINSIKSTYWRLRWKRQAIENPQIYKAVVKMGLMDQFL